jgi:hypothetical protein
LFFDLKNCDPFDWTKKKNLTNTTIEYLREEVTVTMVDPKIDYQLSSTINIFDNNYPHEEKTNVKKSEEIEKKIKKPNQQKDNILDKMYQ